MTRLQTLKPRVGVVSTVRLKAINPESWRDGKTTAERGYGGKWQAARERFLFANPLCVFCMKNGIPVAATVVDHIIPHRGDQKLFWKQSNWQPLCAKCHSSVKQKSESNG